MLGSSWHPLGRRARSRRARSDELVPFDIPNGGGRRFFRNAGRTVRRGGEVGLEVEAGPFSLRAAYDYSHFRYVSYVVGTTSYAGKRIPGVPEHALMTTLSLRVGETMLSATIDLAGTVDVDDANSAQAPGRAIFGLAVSRDVRVGGVQLVAVRRRAEHRRRALRRERERQCDGRKVLRARAGPDVAAPLLRGRSPRARPLSDTRTRVESGCSGSPIQ